MVNPQASAMIAIQDVKHVSATAPRVVSSAIQDINCSQTSHALNVKRFKASSLMKSLNVKRSVETVYFSI